MVGAEDKTEHRIVNTAEFLEKRFSRNESVVSRKVADELILIPIRKSAAEVGSVYTLNETAGRIWELVDGLKTVADIREAIMDEFDVTSGEAEEDLVRLLKQLETVGAIKEN